MSTQHLSISLTLYGSGEWSLALLQTTCVPGRPARKDQLICKQLELDQVLGEVNRAVARLVLEERDRVAKSAAQRRSTPNEPVGRL